MLSVDIVVTDKNAGGCEADDTLGAASTSMLLSHCQCEVTDEQLFLLANMLCSTYIPFPEHFLLNL